MELEDLGTPHEAIVVKEITATIENKVNDRALRSIRPAPAKLLLRVRENTSCAKKLFSIALFRKSAGTTE